MNVEMVLGGVAFLVLFGAFVVLPSKFRKAARQESTETE
jgi:hypothetical protein